ncbi:hypothetical protein BS50DRAFT_627067 [Corynespora cassiicola Philippines]|uniref:NACHT-NTPase and P-loop NTPases N-terminal domain-containing protein n=1 Tax=Corynespora cassiicola Philippines TaxID=1448308 RepID=A0A2T2N136_CORCC|nr:hypothetical protein BS50DRAFT_627095 [Corynespora cassiicola Philippines]PSN58758.1 hypothetical protein BS50DRAFT_627067 [Corynespora cassiicola Philippines]
MFAAYNISKDTNDLPDAFHVVLRKVEPLNNTLARVHDQKSCQEMKSDVESCKQKAENLQTLFRKVVPPSNKPKLDHYREVVRDLGGVGENRVETLMAGLLDDVQSLVPKCTIQRNGKAAELVGNDVMEELAAVFEELPAMPPSLSEDPSGNSVNNWNTGTQNVNTGEGTQNNNTGADMQYISHTQTFSR